MIPHIGQKKIAKGPWLDQNPVPK